MVGVIHRTAAPHWPAIAINPDDVDVAGARCDPFVENACAFVDHRQDHALDDLPLADRSAVDAETRSSLEDGFFDLGIRKRRPRPDFITEISFAGLLAIMPGLAQRVLDESMFAPP